MRLGDLDALKEVINANHYLLSAKNNSTDYGMFTTGIMQAIDNAPTVEAYPFEQVQELVNLNQQFAQEIENLKRPQGEWVPVSERLPKIDEENCWKASDVVLVCLDDGKMHMGFYCEDKKWRFCESEEEKEPFWKDVIAWMPLPEPYKEAEE